jgi:HPt (histidine-containing phosphotransfer) domain-containing protein
MTLQCLLLATGKDAEVLRRTLEAGGCWDVMVAESLQGLSLPESVRPDVILLDGLPTDIAAVIAVLREDGATSRVPVILLTDVKEIACPPEGIAGLLPRSLPLASLPEQLLELVEKASLCMRVAQLQEMGGESFVRRMAALFVDAAPRRLREVQQGLNGGDLPAVERAAHSLQSNAGNMGAVTTQKLAQRIEQLAGASHGEMLTVLVPELAESLSRFLRRLEQRQERAER